MNLIVKLKQKFKMAEKNETPVSSINEAQLNEQKRNEALYQKEQKLEAQVKNLLQLKDKSEHDLKNAHETIERLNNEIEKRDNRARELNAEIDSLKESTLSLMDQNSKLILDIDNQKLEIRNLKQAVIDATISQPTYNEKNPENICPLDFVSPKSEHKDFELGYNCRVVSINEKKGKMKIKNHDNRHGHKDEIEVNILDFKKV